MESMKVIEIMWERHAWEQINFDELTQNCHFGIYQIYGDHPVYGEDVLLYIGKAQDQTFGKRLGQHTELFETIIPRFTRVHLGMFCENEDSNYNGWGELIEIVESLLITAHMPAFNSKGVKRVLDEGFSNYMVINYNDYGSLLPEVSGLKYSFKYWDQSKHPLNFLVEK